MENAQYYNLIPPLAKSEDLGPVSPGGSDDSGVQEEVLKQPQRPPRSIDTPQKLPKHSYINLTQTPPPTLPKRQPYLVQSPNLRLQRSVSSLSVHKKMNNRRGIVCKCKASGK